MSKKNGFWDTVSAIGWITCAFIGVLSVTFGVWLRWKSPAFSLQEIQADPSLIGLCRCPSPVPTQTPGGYKASEDLGKEDHAEEDAALKELEKHKGDYLPIPKSKIYVNLDPYHGQPVRFYYFEHPRCPVEGYPKGRTHELYSAFYDVTVEPFSNAEDTTKFPSGIRRDILLNLDFEVFEALHKPFSGISVVCAYAGIFTQENYYFVWDQRHCRPLAFNYPSEALNYIKHGVKKKPCD